jgi:hypothetical protein
LKAVYWKKQIDTRMKSESFNMLELIAEFGNRLVNFLRELNEVMSPATSSNLEKLVQGGKVSSSLKISFLQKPQRNSGAENSLRFCNCYSTHLVSDDPTPYCTTCPLWTSWSLLTVLGEV